VDDHLMLDRVGPTDSDQSVYLVQQVRAQYGRRASAPDLWVFECDRFAATS
jgi:hypothetical protein